MVFFNVTDTDIGKQTKLGRKFSKSTAGVLFVAKMMAVAMMMMTMAMMTMMKLGYEYSYAQLAVASPGIPSPRRGESRMNLSPHHSHHHTSHHSWPSALVRVSTGVAKP